MARLSVSFVVVLSFVSTALAIANAFFLKKQFYPSVVYLTKSSTSMAVRGVEVRVRMSEKSIYSVLR